MDDNSRKNERRRRANRRKQKSGFKKWFKLFNKFSFWGLILILIGIILDLEFKTYEIYRYIQIIDRVLETIGTALLIGAIFDFSKNSNDFTDLISSILSDIIISRKFLSKLSESDKTEALSLVLQPSNKQLEQYSNINEYFKKQIDSTMKIFNTNFKSHLVLNIFISKKENTVVSEGTISYRIYKIQDKYAPINVIFERENSKVLRKRILYPGGSKNIEPNDDQILENFSQENLAGVKYQRYSFEIPDELNKYPYLTIESDIFEPGFDHWTNFHWTSLTPYDGLSFNLVCNDNLTIKEYIVFDEKTHYDVECSVDKKSMRIISTEWLNSNTGFSITISE